MNKQTALIELGFNLTKQGIMTGHKFYELSQNDFWRFLEFEICYWGVLLNEGK